MKIVIASANAEKTLEMKAMLEGLPVELLSLADFPGAPEVKETGETFQENAAEKAVETALRTGLHAVADDSGLCVDVLDDAPGVQSARYAGRHGTYKDVCKKLLKVMRWVPDGQRAAHFECHIALADPGGDILLRTKGVCNGIITRQMRGGRGFGYDPVFLYPPAGKTFAQMTPREKNKLSHRAKALEELARELRRLFQWP